MSDEGTPRRARGAYPAMLTYEEVRKITDSLASITVRLDTLVTLTHSMEALELRVRALELMRATRGGSSSTWQRVVDLGWGLMLAIIGLGVWFR